MDPKATPTVRAFADAAVDSPLWYGAFKDHVQGCNDCLGDAVLTVISLRVTGEQVFEAHWCSEGDRLLTLVSRALSPRGITSTLPVGRKQDESFLEVKKEDGTNQKSR
jgi:hypothetical protein